MESTSKNIRVERLTALWALNESGLGGFLHVFNTPFTGIIVGGLSILLISLIAYYAENKWKAVIRALIVVLLVKMAVSPHSPPGAYLAVAFQGVTGAFILSKFSWKGMSIPFLGLITFLESALQKLLILTLIYGNGLWEATDMYGGWVQSKLQFTISNSATELLITTYLTIYGFCGILMGIFIKNLIQGLHQTDAKDFYLPTAIIDTHSHGSSQVQKKKPRRFLIFWLVTLVLLVITFGVYSDTQNGWQKAFYLVLRSLLVLSVWYLIVGPLLLRLLKHYLSSQQSRYEAQVRETLYILPYLTPVIKYSWTSTGDLKGLARVKAFITKSITNCIHFKL
jgi:hypothetical protein